jgi:hypothetical protein
MQKTEERKIIMDKAFNKNILLLGAIGSHL